MREVLIDAEVLKRGVGKCGTMLKGSYSTYLKAVLDAGRLEVICEKG